MFIPRSLANFWKRSWTCTLVRLVPEKFSVALNGDRLTSSCCRCVMAKVPIETMKWILERRVSLAERNADSNEERAFFASGARSTSNSSKKMTTGRFNLADGAKALRKVEGSLNDCGTRRWNWTLSFDQSVGSSDRENTLKVDTIEMEHWLVLQWIFIKFTY